VGWVVKEWSSEGLERLLAERSLAAVRAARQSAERDARRARRIADRTAAHADARLEALEALGHELRIAVRAQRTALRGGSSAAPPAPPAPAPAPTPLARPGRPVGAPPPGSARREGRASMRSSALTQLFRPTEPRGGAAFGPPPRAADVPGASAQPEPPGRA
jgi:hypothetical protein